MPTCSKCHPVHDLGRICPHQGPGLAVWEQGYDQGRVDERARWTLDGSTHYEGCETYHPRCEARMLRVIVTDLVAELRTYPDLAALVDWAEARLREVGDE